VKLVSINSRVAAPVNLWPRVAEKITSDSQPKQCAFNESSDGSGSKILTWPKSIFSSSGWVGSAIYGLGLDLENFPQKCQIFQFFSLQVKKISSGWVKNYLGQRPDNLLFNASQKYARVGSGPISRRVTPTEICVIWVIYLSLSFWFCCPILPFELP